MIIFWGKISLFRGILVIFGHIWSQYQIHKKNLGMVTPPPSWQCQYFGTIFYVHPSLTSLLFNPLQHKYEANCPLPTKDNYNYMTQWVLQQCAWFSLYQTPAGFWTIFWVVETPVPNNSSNPISGSGFVVPVPLKGTFFEKNASTQFVKKIFKIVDSNDLAAIQFNETMCCAHCGRCTHALKSSPSVPLSHTAVLSRVYTVQHCSVYIAQDLVKMGNPIFGDCYLNSISDGPG